MPKRPFYSKVPLLLAVCLMTVTPIVPVGAASTAQAQPATQTLPILQVTPANGATVVRPDATIQFVLDPTAQGYNQFVKQYQQGKYTITLNGQTVQGTLDTTTNTITVTNPVLNRYTTYTVLLADTGSTSNGNGGGNGKGNGHGNGGSTGGGNTSSYTFSFTTDSALHEATHLTAAVEQPSVWVTAGGKLDVNVTDDYGLPANNATIQVTGSSSTFSAPVLNLTSTGNGTSVIDLTDHVRELVKLTVTSTDNAYQGTVDTQTASGSEQFLAGPPDHLSINANSPLTVGLGEQVTGTVYDVYNNTVEDTTTVTADTTGGLFAPQQENTSNGNYAFTFTAPTKVQDVVLTAQSGTASGQVTVHLQPDQPANLTLTPDTATVKAGNTDNVQLLVTDQYGNPIPNTQFTVTGTGSSQVPSTVTTDNTGHATIPVSDKKAESMTVTATAANGVQGTAQITLQAGDPANVTLTPDSATVKAGDTDNVQLLVTDQYGNPIPNTQFTVTGTGSSQVPSTVTTDNTGHATIPVSDKKAESVTVTAMAANGVQGTAQITVQAGDPANLTLTPDSATVKAGDTETVQLQVTDQYGNLVPNAAFTVTSTGSSQVPGTVTTDNAGHATIPVSDKKAEPVTIMATAVDGIQGTAQFTVQAGDPANLNLTPDSLTMKAGDTDNVQLLVADQYGNPVPNIQLTVTGTGSSQVPSTVTTDNTGHATIPVSDTKAEPVTVMATAADGTQATANLTVLASNPVQVSAQADKTTIISDGNSSANATVTVTDAYGNPVPNVALTLASTSHATFPATLLTDGNGQATFSVTDPVTESVSITITTSNNVTATLSLQSQTAAPPQATISLIPIMTSGNTPLGYASASSSFGIGSGAAAYKAFDNDTSTAWGSAFSTGWLAYDFQEPAVVQEYTITDDYYYDAPKNWTFEGWDGYQWIVLDTQTNITNWTTTMNTTKSFTIPNTIAYTKYRINVTENNGNGYAYLEIASMTMEGFYAIPFSPTRFTVMNEGDSQVTLSWQPENGVTGYNVYQDGVKVNSTPITSTSYTVTAVQNGLPVITIPYTITGLQNGAIYHYSVTAVNSSGESPQTAPVLAMPYITNLIPVMTSNTTPLGVASASSVLDHTSGDEADKAFDNNTSSGWASNANTGWLEYDFQEPAVVQEYTITDADFDNAPEKWTFEGWDGNQWVVLDTQTNTINWTATPGMSTTEYFTITNTTAYTKYRINGTTTNGAILEITSLTMEGYYAIPFTPNGLTDTSNGDSQVTLTWQPGNGITGYNVYQDGVKVNSMPIPTTSYTITGLQNGTIYHYTVSAVNSSGESPQTAPVLAMPYATNLIPVMTSNNTPSGFASASTVSMGSGEVAYMAFDNNASTAWESALSWGMLEYDFPKPAVVQEYAITDYSLLYAPKDWEFEGWDGSKWVVLDTQTNITNWTTTMNTTKYFTIPNTTAYMDYRINVTADNGSPYLSIASLVFAGTQS